LLAPGDFVAEQFIRRCQRHRQRPNSFRLIDIGAGNGEPYRRAGFSFEIDLILQISGGAVVLRGGRGKAGRKELETCLSILRVEGRAYESIPCNAAILSCSLKELKCSQRRIKRDLVRWIWWIME
jgi:hypothetical protein